jgi:hypothetical protein
MDIGGHPPIPLAQNRVFHLDSFSTVFRVPNFWGRFEALNNIFWGFWAQANSKALAWASQNVFFSARPFQRCIEHPKQISYAKVTPPGS